MLNISSSSNLESTSKGMHANSLRIVDHVNTTETKEKEAKELVLSEQSDARENIPYSAFSAKRKILILSIVAMAGFLGPLAGNIYIPLLPLFESEFKVSTITINGTVSVFMFVMAFAPVFWASWADYGGRKILYLVSLCLFECSNILLASLPAHISSLFILRIIQALGASSVMSLGAGTIADITEPKDRGKKMSYFMLGPQLGPILGPIFSMIALHGQWRWVFGLLSILGLTIYLSIMFFLPETLRSLVGNGETLENGCLFVTPRITQKQIICDDAKLSKLQKPTGQTFLILIKYKPVLICCLNNGLLFASYYALSVTFAKVLQENYNFSNLQCSASYICPGISLITGSLIGGRLSDYLRQKIISEHKTKFIPEKRLHIQLIGFSMCIGGILGYGWSVQRKIHVVYVFVFTFLTSFGMSSIFVTSTTYLTECTTGYPATNVAFGNLCRNLAAAISSLIVDKLINVMTFGWCFTGIALMQFICVIFLMLIIRYGSLWRHEYENKKIPKSC